MVLHFELSNKCVCADSTKSLNWLIYFTLMTFQILGAQ